MKNFLIIIPEGSMLLEAAGVAEILAWVNRQLAGEAMEKGYRVTTACVSPNRVILGRSGLQLLSDACIKDLNPAGPWDTIMITGRVQSSEESRQVVDWIAQAAPHARRVSSVCVGAVVLAQAGLLANRRATTHWRFSGQLQQDYPTIRVDANSIYVKDGPIWTAGGVSSGIDLTLALVEEDHGFAMAKKVAQELVLFLRRPGGQSQFSQFANQMVDSPGPIQKAQNYAMANLAGDLSVERLAEAAAMSCRNFSRVFTKQIGVSPARYVEDIRLEAARSLIEQGDNGLEQIALACGLINLLNLRRVFERRLGISPSEYRQRFGMMKMA